MNLGHRLPQQFHAVGAAVAGIGAGEVDRDLIPRLDDLHPDVDRRVVPGLVGLLTMVVALVVTSLSIARDPHLLRADLLVVLGNGLLELPFLDATFVRMLLVPATMELLGARNWWLPRWLDRILPTLNVEGGTHTSAIALAHEEELREQAERDEQLVDA